MRYTNVIQTTLNESVKLGKKEIEETLKHSQEYQMGVEYEFMPNYNDIDNSEDEIEYIEDLLDDNDIPYIDRVEREHDNMVEVITTEMSITDGLQHIKTMFELGNNNKFRYERFSGMHISISHTNYEYETINMTKFLVLMSAGYLHSIFPERKYVNNIERVMIQAMREVMDNDDKFDVNELEEFISDHKKVNEKYVTIKISDYVDSSGRIELRFLGGENYGERFKDIRWQLLRSIYILSIAYDDDMYHKEYQQSLYKLYSKAMKEDIVDYLKNNDSHFDDLISLYFKDRTTTRNNLKTIARNIRNIGVDNVSKIITNLKQRFPDNKLVDTIYINLLNESVQTGDPSSIISVLNTFYINLASDELKNTVSSIVKEYIANNTVETDHLTPMLEYLTNEDMDDISELLVENYSFIDVLQLVLKKGIEYSNLFIKYLKSNELKEKEIQYFPKLDKFPVLVELIDIALGSDISSELKQDILRHISGTFNFSHVSFKYIDDANSEDRLRIKTIFILSQLYSGEFKDYGVENFWDDYNHIIKDVIAESDEIGFAFAKLVLDNYRDKLTDNERDKLDRIINRT